MELKRLVCGVFLAETTHRTVLCEKFIPVHCFPLVAIVSQSYVMLETAFKTGIQMIDEVKCMI